MRSIRSDVNTGVHHVDVAAAPHRSALSNSATRRPQSHRSRPPAWLSSFAEHCFNAAVYLVLAARAARKASAPARVLLDSEQAGIASGAAIGGLVANTSALDNGLDPGPRSPEQGLTAVPNAVAPASPAGAGVTQ
jgi:hypothetical protein